VISRSLRILALALALVSLIACTSGGSATTPTGSLLPSTVDALPAMDAATFATLIAQQRGTPVLVNIWASWCGPCEAETPDIVAAHAAWGDRVRFIGVDAQDDRSGATEFLARHRVTYPSVFNPSNDIAISFGLFSPPDTLFFDADGTLVKTIPGVISAHDLRANLRAITN
jgi:cytochrome c biogenesis protein CcmG/thiol:disulfide interchange protein DsbE